MDRHPSYGVIRISRINGGHKSLFMSPHRHNHYISIEVMQAEHHRDLHSSDAWAKGQPIVQLAMSETQWARFVASAGLGSGVPCTLEWIQDKAVPPCPPPDPPDRVFHDELKAKLEGLKNELIKLSKIEGPLTKRATAELARNLSNLAAAAGPNIDFTMEMFNETVTSILDSAKSEIDGYVSLLQRMGRENDFLVGATDHELLASPTASPQRHLPAP